MCGSCNVTYYGKTEGHFNVRPGENLGLSLSTGNMVACKPSAISDYLLLHEHTDSSFTTFQSYRVKITYLRHPWENQF